MNDIAIGLAYNYFEYVMYGYLVIAGIIYIGLLVNLKRLFGVVRVDDFFYSMVMSLAWLYFAFMEFMYLVRKVVKRCYMKY